MKRFVLLAAFTAALPVIALACGDSSDGGGPAPGTPDSGPTSTATNTTPTSTATTPPVDAGPDAPARRTGCLDRPTNVERPDRLPCELIPPGLTL
ncbi:MAG: hypothetical protein KIT84_22505 [Labilithrix sp.]|nr:hypothetical protein [Labilithrix sp.]MCW5813816.1 hypothetical protein [Labilithrix sp.]